MSTKSKASGAKAQEQVTETIENLSEVGKETLEKVITAGTEAAAEGYKNATAYGKEQFETAKGSYDKVAQQGKNNLDAYAKASAALFAGYEAYFGQMLDYTKSAVSENTEFMQKFAAAKEPQDYLDVQLEAVNASVNRAVAQSTKLNQITTDTVVKSAAPMKAQMEKSVEAFVKPFVG